MRLLIILLVLSIGSLLNGQTDANTPMKGITIYVEYPDAPALVQKEQLDSILNGVTYQENGIERTHRAYWHQQSRRNIDITHDIFYFMAPEPFSYYESLDWRGVIDTWKEALNYINDTSPNYDWDQLSLDEEGNLASVMFISSKWGAPGWGGAHYPRWQLNNGLEINKIYGSVLQAPWDNQHNLFMTTHEAGHGIFRFPDTYDTEYNSNGTSFYTLMSGGQPDMEPIGGPFLVEQGWGHVVELAPGTHTVTLKADGDSVFVYRNPHDESEFFTLEARKKSNIGNSLFPARIGLLLWHSDNKINTSNTKEQMEIYEHYRHSIEQADGLFELEGPIGKPGDRGDLYLPGRSFSDATTPDSKWWNGESSNFEIKDIEVLGDDHMRFTVVIPELHNDHYDEVPQDGWAAVSGPTSQSGFELEKAFDGNPDTYYHLPWGNTEPRPHDVVIALGETYTLNEFYYTANDNYSPPWEGRIEFFQLFVSDDLDDWGDPVAMGKMFRTEYRQYIPFEAKSGSFIKFSALTSYDDDARTSIAEMSFRGILSDLLDAEDIEDQSLNEAYPNPTSNIINVISGVDKMLTMKVLDAAGREMVNQPIKARAALDVSNFESGVYFILIVGDNYRDQMRFIKN